MSRTRKEDLPVDPVPGQCSRRPQSTDTRCRCSQACVNLALDARRRRALQKETRGGLPGPVSAAYCAEYIRSVLKARPDATMRSFVQAAGVHEGTVRRLFAEEGNGGMVRRSTAERIFAVQPKDLEVPRDLRIVEPTLAKQWVQEMRARGWSISDISRASGLSLESLTMKRPLRAESVKRLYVAYTTTLAEPKPAANLTLVARQIESLATMGWPRTSIAEVAGIGAQIVHYAAARTRCTVENAEAIQAAYHVLRYQEGPSDRLRDLSRSRGFAHASMWPEGAMGDPEAVPEVYLMTDRKWKAAIRKRYGITARQAAAPKDSYTRTTENEKEATRAVA